jgi:RNA polymerase sigma factor (TIGR02999 family)
MTESQRITDVLKAASAGDPRASSELLPLVYEELRRLARARMAGLPPGNTLQPTALVHEAFLRLVDAGGGDWNTRGHFFAAAARAMRQILVDQARRKASRKRGGDRQRLDADEVEIPIEAPGDDMIALDRALERLENDDPRKAQIVMYRYFAGLDREETASAMGISVRTVDREWRYIRGRLYKELRAP